MGVLMGGQGLAIQRQLNFSRDAEREADRVGFQIMRAAATTPRAWWPSSSAAEHPQACTAKCRPS
jgi:predicted Zn-dependent protease